MSSNIVLVFLGSGIGGVMRYLISIYFSTETGKFPIQTIIANSIACLAIGIILSNPMDSPDYKFKKLFLAIGICGGLSTFSTFSYELIQSGLTKDWILFLSYTIMSFSLGLILTWCGIYIGNKI